MIRSTTLPRRLTAALALLTLAAAPALAGPLNPPSGAVGPTMKTLAEVEPRTAINETNTPGTATGVYRITEPGSYYLTGNITVPAGRSGIEVAASNVTIDLSGFVITGLSGSVDGVTTVGAAARVAVRNGVIADPGRDGVRLRTSGITTPQSHVVENVRVRNAGTNGIFIADGLVRNCLVYANGGAGVLATSQPPADTVVESCAAVGNGYDGFYVQRGIVRDSSASQNTGDGIYLLEGTVQSCTVTGNSRGIIVSYSGLITNCHAIDNTTNGIVAGGGSLVLNNSVRSLSLTPNSIGISLQNAPGGRAQGNVVARQATGIRSAAAGNLIIGNSIHGCTTAVNAVAGSAVGTLVTVSSPAINGNSGGGLGTSDPNANLITSN